MLTAQQRSEINRRNAANSTGPKTEEGKARSRQNALKHGCRSEILALDHENKEELQAREQEWFAYYDPQSPAAKHLTACCVRATLLAERVDRYEYAIVAKQIRHAEIDQREADEEATAEHMNLLETEPRLAVDRLRRTAFGVRAMIKRWHALRSVLEAGGAWSPSERDLAIRLQGEDPSAEKLRSSPSAFVTRFFSDMCRPNETVVRWLRQPAVLPDAFREMVLDEQQPDPDACRDQLRAIVDDQLSLLRDLESTLATAHEAPDAAEAPDRSSLPADPQAARLLLRYRTEARTSFHKAFTELRRTLKEDAAREPEPAETVAPNEPKSPPEPSDPEPLSTNAGANSSPPVDAAPPILVFQPQVTARAAEIDDPDGRGIRSVGPPAF